ncbi:MAG: hypothetical protein LBV46_00630 [Bacteroidales bacterium]|jgi:trigger factor|nr:hypothetical protein [Bacteroidales bacterium]
MNITKEKEIGLLEEIVIEITREDYSENVENALKKHRRTAQVPGFRVGNVPVGMIKRMYEKGAIAEEVNNLISKALDNYFEENKIAVILEPLPVEEKSKMDFENPDTFVCAFEFVHEPVVDIEFDKLPAVEDFKILASEQFIDEFVSNLRRKYGNFVQPDVIAEADFVTLEYTAGEEKKDGYIYQADINDEAKKLFIGKKLNETLTVSFKDIFISPEKLAKFLKLKEEELDPENNYTYEATVASISRVEEAPLDEDFFHKAYPDHSVHTIEELRADAAKQIERQWQAETDKFFMNNAIPTLMNSVAIELPEEFIKRFLLATSKMDAATIDAQMAQIIESYKWQLIENKILADNDIKVTQEDVKDYIRQYFMFNYFSQFNQEDVADRIETLVNDAMKNKEDVRNIYEQLVDAKLRDVLKTKMTINLQKGDMDTFIAKMQGEKVETNASDKKAKTAKKKDTTEKTKEKPAKKSKEAKIETKDETM